MCPGMNWGYATFGDNEHGSQALISPACRGGRSILGKRQRCANVFATVRDVRCVDPPFCSERARDVSLDARLRGPGGARDNSIILSRVAESEQTCRIQIPGDNNRTVQ